MTFPFVIPRGKSIPYKFLAGKSASKDKAIEFVLCVSIGVVNFFSSIRMAEEQGWGWTVFWDHAQQRNYYYNYITGESSWEEPMEGDKNVRLRERVIQEIVSTESDYIRDLQILRDVTPFLRWFSPSGL